MKIKELGAGFPLMITQELVWSDMDAYQHVNNAVYFRYFEDARIAYFEKAQIKEQMEQTGVGPILASTRCDFRAPLTFPDTIHVATGVVETWRNRFRMEYIVYSENLNKVVAEGEGLVVYFDYKRNRSCDIPDPVLLAIDRLQTGVKTD